MFRDILRIILPIDAALYPLCLCVYNSNCVASLLQPSCYDSIIMIKKLPYLPDIIPSSSGAYSIFVEDFMMKVRACPIVLHYFLGRLLWMQSRVRIRHRKKSRPKNLLCYNVKYCREKMNKKYTFVASARAGAAHFYLMNFIVFIDSYEHIIYNLSVNHKMLSSYGQCNEILYPSFFKRKTHLLIFEQ